MARLIDGEVRVIATGGGAYVDPRTRRLLNERAITVWLDAPVDGAGRAHRAPRHPRPASYRGPHATLERLASERRAAYAEAHIQVTSGDGAHRDVVEAIVEAIRGWLKDRVR